MSLLRSPRFWMSVAMGIGLFASAYLLFEYVTGGPIVCGQAGGCEIVRASAQAYIGPIPRPLLGVAFYAGMLALLIARSLTSWRATELKWLTQIGAVVGIIESGHLFFVQWLVIKSFCVWCLTSGAATVVIGLCAAIEKKYVHQEERLQDLKGYTLTIFLLMVMGVPAFVFLVR